MTSSDIEAQMFSPEWIEAAADMAAALEKGVAMRGNRKPAEPAVAAAAPTPVNVTVTGMSPRTGGSVSRAWSQR